MPPLSPDTLLVELVGERPPRARILDRLGIDSGRESERSLAEACEAQGLEPETVARMLNGAVETVPTEGNPEWLSVSLPDLMDRIQSTHHDDLRRALLHLSKRLKMASRNPDGERAQWVERVHGAFQALRSNLMADLRRHLHEEPHILFPRAESLL